MPRFEDDDRDDRPRKKSSSREKAESGWRHYKKSPIRFAILGVLLAIMMVMGYMLYLKKEREKQQDQKASSILPMSMDRHESTG